VRDGARGGVVLRHPPLAKARRHAHTVCTCCRGDIARTGNVPWIRRQWWYHHWLAWPGRVVGGCNVISRPVDESSLPLCLLVSLLLGNTRYEGRVPPGRPFITSGRRARACTGAPLLRRGDATRRGRGGQAGTFLWFCGTVVALWHRVGAVWLERSVSAAVADM
jgi:hypothetical protein